MRWEWNVPDCAPVVATIDDSGHEALSVGGRVVSRAPRGAKKEGHVVDLAEGRRMVVTFDPRQPICVLRVDGQEIAPDRWPVRGKRPMESAPTPRSLRGVVIAAVLCLVAGMAFLFGRPRQGAKADVVMTETHRAPGGLFVAHFPNSFVASVATTPIGVAGVVLEERQGGSAVVILALPDAPRDPWLLQKKLQAEALAQLPRSSAAYEEKARIEEPCVGRPGAVILGRATNRRGEATRIWSCAFLEGDAGYLIMTSRVEGGPPSDDQGLRRIAEATELTKLGEITPPR